MAVPALDVAAAELDGSPGTGGSAGTGGAGGVGGSSDIGFEVELQVDDDYITGLVAPLGHRLASRTGTVLVTERPWTHSSVFADGVDSPAAHAIPLQRTSSRPTAKAGMMGTRGGSLSSMSNGYIYICMASNAGIENDVRVVRLTMSRPSAESVEDRTRYRHGDAAQRRLVRAAIVVAAPASDQTASSGSAPGTPRLRIHASGQTTHWAARCCGSTREGAIRRPDNPGRPPLVLEGASQHPKAWRSARTASECRPSMAQGSMTRSTSSSPGNFGWDPVNEDGSPGYDESVPMTDLAKFPHADGGGMVDGLDRPLPWRAQRSSKGNAWGDWDGVLAVADAEGLAATHARSTTSTPTATSRASRRDS